MLKYRITTPEQVSFHYEIAGLITRAMAWLIDQTLLWTLRLTIIFVFLFNASAIGCTVALLLFFVLDFGYYTAFELFWSGQTPGKRVLKLRVLSCRGGRLEFPDVLIRNLIRAIDSLPVFMVVGGGVALIDPLHRRLGDMAADTLVIRDAPVKLPRGLLAQLRRVNSFQADSAVRQRILSRITRDERDLILDLMLRRDEMAPSAREELFSRAAAYFRGRYALPQDAQEYLSDEQTVLNLALVIQSVKYTE